MKLDEPTLFDATATLEAVEDKPRRFKPYPRVKPSGVPWLGSIPHDWSVERLRFCARVNPPKSEITHLREEDDVSFVPMEALHEFGGMTLEQTRPLAAVQQGYTYFRDGDVVIAKITPCFENGKGSIAAGLVNSIGFGTTELHVIRAGRKLDRRFAFYLTVSDPFRKLGTAEMYGAGGQKRVPDAFVQDFRTPLPPDDEQRAIADFLDHETAKIDSLVAKKRRLIDLLKEKRTALISRAVTKGLNPAAPMKPSGIEWLGAVPKDWELLRLKFLSRIQGGVTLGKKYDPGTTITRPYLRVANVQDGYLDLEEITQIDIPPDEVERYELRHGDVLMTEGGDFDKLGRGYVWEDQIAGCLHQNHIFAVRPDQRRLDSHFLAAMLTSSHAKNYFTSTSQQTTNLATTNRTKIGNLVLPLPRLGVQREILSWIKTHTSAIEAVRKSADVAIQKLAEYRSALISAAVTGKIDVRGES